MTATPTEEVKGTAAASSAVAPAPDAKAAPTKPSGDAKAEDSQKPKQTLLGEIAAEATKPVVPESYKFDLGDAAPSKEVVEFVSQMAKQGQMTQEQAQKAMSEFIAVRQRESAEAIERIGNDLRKQIEQDPELGGAKLPQTQASIARALKRFGSPEAVEVLNHPLVGNQKAIAAMLKKIGDAFQDDAIVTGNAAPAQRSGWDKLYTDGSL